jgi:hypothetical protein
MDGHLSCYPKRYFSKGILKLMNQTIKETYVELSPDERQLYQAVEERARVQINRYLREGVVMKNYSCILAMLVRLRQVFS